MDGPSPNCIRLDITKVINFYPVNKSYSFKQFNIYLKFRGYFILPNLLLLDRTVAGE